MAKMVQNKDRVKRLFFKSVTYIGSYFLPHPQTFKDQKRESRVQSWTLGFLATHRGVSSCVCVFPCGDTARGKSFSLWAFMKEDVSLSRAQGLWVRTARVGPTGSHLTRAHGVVYARFAISEMNS